MVDFNQALLLDALIGKLYEVTHWEPDYEECGPQFGPSMSKALPILDEILKISYSKFKMNSILTPELKEYIMEKKLQQYYHIIPLPERDGVDHINVYSKGKTSIGKFLSNFERSPIETEDGHFESIEGYWYWLSCKDDKLRKLYGWQAKQYGRSVRAKDWSDDPEFKRKICAAIEIKVINKYPKMEFSWAMCEDLPFKHYYVYEDKIIEPSDGKWIIEFLEELRTRLCKK